MKKNKKQVWHQGWCDYLPIRFFDKIPPSKNKKGKKYLRLRWKVADANKLLKTNFAINSNCYFINGNVVNGWFFIDDDGKDELYKIENNEWTKQAIVETKYILLEDLSIDYDIPFFMKYRYILKLQSNIEQAKQQPQFEKYISFTHKSCKFLIHNKNGSILFDNGLKQSRPIQLNDNKDGVIVPFDYNGKIYNETFMFDDMANFK